MHVSHLPAEVFTTCHQLRIVCEAEVRLRPADGVVHPTFAPLRQTEI